MTLPAIPTPSREQVRTMFFDRLIANMTRQIASASPGQARSLALEMFATIERHGWCFRTRSDQETERADLVGQLEHEIMQLRSQLGSVEQERDELRAVRVKRVERDADGRIASVYEGPATPGWMYSGPLATRSTAAR